MRQMLTERPELADGCFVSRRYSTSVTLDRVGGKPSTRVEGLLDELCVAHGCCLPPDERAALIDNPPETSDAFVDAVLRAEGLAPTSLDKHARVALSDVVRDWLFDEGRGKGTRSGLP